MTKISLNEKTSKPNNKFKKFFVNLWEMFCKLFFPSKIKCVCCGRDLVKPADIEFCEHCKQKLPYLKNYKICKVCGTDISGMSDFCISCKSSKREFVESRSVFIYKDNVKKLILNLKFSNKPYLAETLGAEMAELFKTLNWKIDVVIPVPLSAKRLKWRGYNQAELLAKSFCKYTNLTLNTDVLEKINDTSQQAKLNYSERQTNLLKSFKVKDKQSIKDKTVLLIDDIVTTCATANVCSKVLKNAGAKTVYVLSVARTSVKIPQEKGLDSNKKLI